MQKSLMTLTGVGLIAATVAVEMQTTAATPDADPAARKGEIRGGMIQKGREKWRNAVQPRTTTPENPPVLPPVTTKGHAVTIAPEAGESLTTEAAPTAATDRTVTPPVDGKGINQGGVRSPN